jgi:hypothetical protein
MSAIPATTDATVLREIAELRAVVERQADELHRLGVFIRQTLTVRVDVISETEAAKRLGTTPRTLCSRRQRGLLTDARPASERRVGCRVMYFSDEIEAWANGGEHECQRLRSELGRE